jgi:hypothetical protein
MPWTRAPERVPYRHAMRRIAIVALFGVACGQDAPAPAPPGAGAAPATMPAAAGGVAAVSDEELTAFVAWQRDRMALIAKQVALIQELSTDDASKPMDQLLEERQAAVGEATTRHAAAMQEHDNRCPLKGRRFDLATAVLRGLYGWEHDIRGARLFIGRDEHLLGVARAKFGDAAVDGLVAREPLILAELQRP